MNFLKRIIQKKYSLLEVLIIVFVTSLIRVIIDFGLLQYPLELDIFQHYVRFYLENLYFFMIAFVVGSFVMSKLMNRGFVEVANGIMKIYPVIILPPLIDYFIAGRRLGYEYATTENFLYNFFTISWIQGDATLGISFEITLGLVLFGLFVYRMTSSWAKVIIAVLLTTVMTVFISTPELLFGGRADYYYLEFLPFYYFYPFIFISMFLLWYYQKEKCVALLKHSKPVTGVIFFGVVAAGGFAAAQYGSEFNVLRVLLAGTSIFFVWLFSTIINDIYDLSIDRKSNANRPLVKKIFSLKEYWLISVVYAFLAFSFSSILGVEVAILVLFGLAISIVYSMPPLRFRNNFLGNISMGAGMVISFLVGYSAIGGFSFNLEKNALLFLLIAFLYTTIGTTVKDIKDLRSDATFGVKNLFTVFGKKKGKNVVTSALFVTLNSPAFILNELFLLLPTLVGSMIACYSYHANEERRIVYVITAVLGLLVFWFAFR